MSTQQDIVINLVVARVSAIDKYHSHELKIVKNIAKETKSSYMWERTRLAKDKLLQIELAYESSKMIGFKTYCLEKDLEEAKQLCLDGLKKEVNERCNLAKIMESLIEKEAIITIRDERE